MFQSSFVRACNVQSVRLRSSFILYRLFSSNLTLEEEIDVANVKGQGKWEVRLAGAKGYGIFLLRDYAPREVVFRANGMEASRERYSHSVQTGWNTHVRMDLPGRLINHSCQANTGVRDNELGAFDFVALKELKKGEELTWDYGAAEFSPSSMPFCLCGQPLCRARPDNSTKNDTRAGIGFEHAHHQIRKLYGPFCASYLQGYQPS